MNVCLWVFQFGERGGAFVSGCVSGGKVGGEGMTDLHEWLHVLILRYISSCDNLL